MQISYLSYSIHIGQKITYKGLIITLTEEIVNDNPTIFIQH